MNSNVYDDPESTEDMEKLEIYWKGRDDGRLESGGGLPTLLSGAVIGALSATIIWIMAVLWW
jgi:hypothetical protein